MFIVCLPVCLSCFLGFLGRVDGGGHFAHMSVCLSVCQSLCLSIYLSVCLSMYLSPSHHHHSPWEVVFPLSLQIKPRCLECVCLLLHGFSDHRPEAVRDGQAEIPRGALGRAHHTRPDPGGGGSDVKTVPGGGVCDVKTAPEGGAVTSEQLRGSDVSTTPGR